VINLGRISELINQMIESVLRTSEFTSASPGHINTFIQTNTIENPNFEEEIAKLVDKNGGGGTQAKKTELQEKSKESEKKLSLLEQELDSFSKGNVGKIQRFTSEQFGNIQQLSSNPLGFVLGKLGTKLARGGVIIGLIMLIEQIVHFVISESMKPGRWLDRRLKVTIEDQVLSFTRRNELAELRQGFRTVFVTASPFIRGQAGVVGSNLMFQHGTGSKPYETKPHVIDTHSTTGNTKWVGRYQ
jgi:hypothetical protein